MRTKSFFLALLSFASLTASAQQSETQTTDSLVKAAYFVDGKYYSKELPTDEADAQSMGFVTLSKDYMIVNITLRKGATVPQSWAKYEIPRNRVKGIAEIDEEIKNRELMNKRMFPEGGYKYLELEVGKPLPGHFAEYDIDGNPWTDELIKGRKVVVNAWFSGCGPCLREMPILSEWKEQLPDVLFLSVNFEKADKVRRITQQRGFNWNHIYDDKYFVRFVGTGGFPLFLVLDEKGIVRYVGNGPNDGKRAEILKLIKSL